MNKFIVLNWITIKIKAKLSWLKWDLNLEPLRSLTILTLQSSAQPTELLRPKPVWWMYFETTLYKVGVCLGQPFSDGSSQSGFMKSPNFGNPEGCLKFWANILKRHLVFSSDLVLSIFKVVNNEVPGTSLFAQKEVVNEEVFLKFNVTPYTVLLYVLLKVPAIESDLKLPS